MKKAGWFKVFSTGMVLGTGWADAAEALSALGAPSAIYGKVVDAVRVPEETVVIGNDGFAVAHRLNSRRPLPVGVRAAARDGREKRARSVSRWGTWEGKGRSFDIQGRDGSFRLGSPAMPRVFPSK